MAKYKVFKNDSRNSGFYVQQDITLKDARVIAIRLSKTKYPKSRLEGEKGYFETYENGAKTEWSAKYTCTWCKNGEHIECEADMCTCKH